MPYDPQSWLNGDITAPNGPVNDARLTHMEDGIVNATDVAEAAIPDGVGVLTTGQLADGAVTSAKIQDGAIVDVDISGTAAITPSKISPSVTNGDVLTTSGGVTTWAAGGGGGGPTGTAGGDLSGTYPNPAIASGAVTSAKIADGTIVNADINAAAAIAPTKVLAGTDGQVLTSTSGATGWASPTGGPPSGSAGGDLAGTYPNPTIGTGKVTSTHILDGTIVNADINASAAVAVSKLAAGTNGQVLTISSGVPTWAAAAGGAPTGSAGGSLAGTYPNPTIAAGAVTGAAVASAIKDPATGTAGLRTIGTGTQQALNADTADLRYGPQIPGLVTTLGPGAIFFANNASTVGAANQARTSRAYIPFTGRLHDVAIWVVTASGNVEVGILDTNSTRNRKWTSGSIACPTAASWQVVGDPNLAVSQGEAYEFYIACDNNTATFRCQNIAGGQASLPTSFAPAVGGASPKLAALVVSGFTMPSTVSEANMTQAGVGVLIIARVA